MLDIFRSDAFSTTALTATVNKLPYKPGRIGALGIFGELGIAKTSVVIEERDGELTLIQTSPRGGVGSTIGALKRKARAFTVPHLQRESTIMADEVQGVRAFGSEDSTEAVQAVVNERMTRLRSMHEATLEHMRASAIQGIVLDADGSTLFDLFTEFGVSQQTAVLTPSASTDEGDELRGEVVAAQRLAENELGAEPISGYRAFCGTTFFDTMRTDKGMVQTLREADPASLLAQPNGIRTFNFAGVAWEEYRGNVGGSPFFAADEAYLFPEGTGYFITRFAPGDFMETVNTLGLPIYAKMAEDPKFQRYTELHTQSNPLAICTRPRIVVKLTLGT